MFFWSVRPDALAAPRDETSRWTPERLYAEAKDELNSGAYDKAIESGTDCQSVPRLEASLTCRLKIVEPPGVIEAAASRAAARWAR